MKNDKNPAMRAKDKWGEAAAAGFQLVPDILLKNQAALELTPTDMLVLLNVLMHWWYEDHLPFPRSTTIAARMNVQPRTVQRSLARLGQLGLMKKIIEHLPNGEERQVCDPSGLKERLIKIARGNPFYNPSNVNSEAYTDVI